MKFALVSPPSNKIRVSGSTAICYPTCYWFHSGVSFSHPCPWYHHRKDIWDWIERHQQFERPWLAEIKMSQHVRCHVRPYAPRSHHSQGCGQPQELVLVIYVPLFYLLFFCFFLRCVLAILKASVSVHNSSAPKNTGYILYTWNSNIVIIFILLMELVTIVIYLQGDCLCLYVWQ